MHSYMYICKYIYMYIVKIPSCAIPKGMHSGVSRWFFVHEARWKESTSHAPGIPSDWLGRQLLAVTPEIFDEAGNTETQALK